MPEREIVTNLMKKDINQNQVFNLMFLKIILLKNVGVAMLKIS
jgi:hypothetical protein